MAVSNLHNHIIDEDIARILSEDLPWEEFRGATILVTGASGMIPSYVVYTLLGLNDTRNLGIKVIALVRNEQKARNIFGEILDREDVSLLVQDVTQPLQLEGPVDYIVHGASSAKPREHKATPTNTIKANVIGTFNLIDLAVEKKSRGFVLMSSSEVYGMAAEGIESIKEDDYGYLDCLNPRSCYSEGKRAAETICASYSAQYGIRCTIARFAHIYGPGLSLDDGRVQADFAANVVRGEDIVMHSDGSSQRAYTYVADAVSAMFYALLKGSNMAYNIADSDNITSIRQLAEAFVSARPNKNLKLIIDVDEESANNYNPAKFIGLDNSKISSLGWTPKTRLSDGVDKMLRHYEETLNYVSTDV